MKGRECDNCEHHLDDEDYISFGSWSYTCPDCGFVYRHGKDLQKQLMDFNLQEDEEE